MNATEYADYETRFAEGMDGYSHLGIGGWLEDCSECPSDAEYENGVCYGAEAYFSWSYCDICDSRMGGNRTDSHAFYDGQLTHLRVCDDCVYYAEYGRLDDQTMAEVEATR